MQIHLIAVGSRMPAWVADGYAEYARRMPGECRLRLVEIPPGRRSKGADVARAKHEEGQRMLAALPRDSLVVGLEVSGKSWSTTELANRLGQWLQDGRDIALFVGGPDGLASGARERCDLSWSLSSLTLPHMLVRIVVAEQLYRAWSVLKQHPYHR